MHLAPYWAECKDGTPGETNRRRVRVCTEEGFTKQVRSESKFEKRTGLEDGYRIARHNDGGSRQAVLEKLTI